MIQDYSLVNKAILLKVLMRAREIVANGWTTGTLCERVDGKVCYCPLGAIYKASGFGIRPALEGGITIWESPRSSAHDAAPTACETLMDRVLWDGQAYDSGLMVSFNDRKAKSVEDVVMAFDWAIGITEAGGF